MSAPTILLVDDFDDGRALVAELLADAGYRTVEAGSGPEALDKVAAQTPDLVLLDLSLPGMDGWQLARELRAGPVGDRLRIMALTAHSGQLQRARALEAGCDEVLTKPCAPAALVERVAALLQRAPEGSTHA